MTSAHLKIEAIGHSRWQDVELQDGVYDLVGDLVGVFQTASIALLILGLVAEIEFRLTIAKVTHSVRLSWRPGLRGLFDDSLR